jgi:hypothetical protein
LPNFSVTIAKRWLKISLKTYHTKILGFQKNIFKVLVILGCIFVLSPCNTKTNIFLCEVRWLPGLWKLIFGILIFYGKKLFHQFSTIFVENSQRKNAIIVLLCNFCSLFLFFNIHSYINTCNTQNEHFLSELCSQMT